MDIGSVYDLDTEKRAWTLQSFIDKENKIQDILDEVEGTQLDLGKDNMKKYREIFENNSMEKSTITVYNLTYCEKSLKQFFKVKEKFLEQKKMILETKNFPQLTFHIPIDNFESDKVDEEQAW